MYLAHHNNFQIVVQVNPLFSCDISNDSDKFTYQSKQFDQVKVRKFLQNSLIDQITQTTNLNNNEPPSYYTQQQRHPQEDYPDLIDQRQNTNRPMMPQVGKGDLLPNRFPNELQNKGMHMGPNNDFFKRPHGAKYDDMYPDITDPTQNKMKKKYMWLE
ncbi:Hypothetical_protein [Hexamita inflata]|uniref:Hypothetical_protein n=1 Tax=Hexamita inflata TaxID=28002 RepID=A0AA86UJR0_9EUKA|nr:Hypothetical protein HINF_LOCUS48675 [Hexamita inflata]